MRTIKEMEEVRTKLTELGHNAKTMAVRNNLMNAATLVSCAIHMATSVAATAPADAGAKIEKKEGGC